MPSYLPPHLRRGPQAPQSGADKRAPAAKPNPGREQRPLTVAQDFPARRTYGAWPAPGATPSQKPSTPNTRPPHPSQQSYTSIGPYPPQSSRRERFSPASSGPSHSRQVHNANAVNAWALESPAGHLKPMRQRATPTKTGEMEMIQSISRSGGDGGEGDALKNWETQKRYRAYIDEKMAEHHDKFGPISVKANIKGKNKDGGEEIESLAGIVLCLRKLREGVVASGRIDGFAIEVFETSAQYAILAHNRPQLLSALSGLVSGQYRAYDLLQSASHDDLSRRLDRLQLKESDGPQDRRSEFASLLLLYHLVTSGNVAFDELWLDLTAPRSCRLAAKFEGEGQGPRTISWAQKPFVECSKLAFAKAASQSLAKHSFNPIRFFSLLASPTATVFERIILSWSVPQIQDQAWAMSSKAYMSASIVWAGELLGLDSSNVESWVRDGGRGGRVEDERVLLR